MGQSLSQVYLHAVFSTKNRARWFDSQARQKELWAFIAGTSNQLACPTKSVGGTEDHVHVLFRLHRNMSQVEWIKEVKRRSSIWLKDRFTDFSGFSWQQGYALFSVSQSNIDKVHHYILNQEKHHQSMGFKTEFLELLRRHRMDWDERYVWD